MMITKEYQVKKGKKYLMKIKKKKDTRDFKINEKQKEL